VAIRVQSMVWTHRRGFLRASLSNPDIDVVAVTTSRRPEVNAHLLR